MKGLSYIIGFVLTFCSFISIGQEIKEGIIIDAEDSVAVPYVHVYFDTGTYGTVANIAGKFSIKIDQGRQLLIFSCVGYEKLVLDVQDVPNKVYLTRSTSLLEDVVVTPEKIDLQKLMKEVISSYSSNYNSLLIEADYFYREEIQSDDKYTWFLESTGQWLDQGYHESHFETSKYQFLYAYNFYKPEQLRAVCIEPWKSLYWDEIRTPELFIFTRSIRYLLPQTHKYYNYDLADIINGDCGKIYKVSFEPKSGAVSKLATMKNKYERNPGFILSSGTYYVCQSSKSLIRIDYNFESSRNEKSKGVSFSGSYQFKSIDGKYFPIYAVLYQDLTHNNVRYNEKHELFLTNHQISKIDVDQIAEKYDFVFDRRDAYFKSLPNLVPSKFYPEKEIDIQENYGIKSMSGFSYHAYMPAYSEEYWSTTSIPPNENWEKIKKDFGGIGKMKQYFNNDWFLEYYNRLD